MKRINLKFLIAVQVFIFLTTFGIVLSSLSIKNTTISFINPIESNKNFVIDKMAWQEDGIPICNSANDQSQPYIISDGSDGAIIVWRDTRTDSNGDVYAQRIDENGTTLWNNNGIAVCTVTTDVWYVKAVSDGAGGAIIVWRDQRGSDRDIYAQRINSTGDLNWTSEGVVICNATNHQDNPSIISDGAGGAIITWEDLREGLGNFDIYAQRINSDGVTQWTPNGTVICNATQAQNDPRLCTDGNNGAIITWRDTRTSYPVSDIFAQRINSTGYIEWTLNGVVISNENGYQTHVEICSDVIGGAILTWSDSRDGNEHIYAQRVNSLGITQWTTNGTDICIASNDQFGPEIASDASGGAYIVWIDTRTIDGNIYAQRVGISGVSSWQTNGIAICSSSGEQGSPQIAVYGSDTYITWQDQRSNSTDIYVQKIASNGSRHWISNGAPVCTNLADNSGPKLCISGAGEAIITWYDYRNVGSIRDIYAQSTKNITKHSAGGNGENPAGLLLLIMRPEDIGVGLAIGFTLVGVGIAAVIIIVYIKKVKE